MTDFSTWRDKPATERTWQEKVHMATCMMVAMERHFRPDQGRRAARRAVIRNARIALDPQAKIRTKTFDLTGSDGLGPAEPVIETPGIIRMILVNEVPGWAEPMIAENVMAIVQHAVEAELDRPSAPAA